MLSGLFALRVPLVIGLATVAVLTVPDQVREIHRILTQERTENILQLALGLVRCFRCSPCRSCSGRRRASTPRISTDEIAGEPGGTLRWMLAWGPRLLATLPLLGAALGIWLSRSPIVRLDDINVEDIPENAQGHPQAAGRHGRRVHQGRARVRRSRRAGLRPGRRCSSATLPRRAAAGRAASRSLNNWLLFPLFILASIGLLIYYPVWLPQQLGSIPIFALWMANLAVLLALFWRLLAGSSAFRSSALLVVLLIAFEVLGPHRQPPVPPQTVASGIQRPSVEESFRTWLGSRADLDAYRTAGKPYPVYIVAAEGGGLYAAYQTAKLLGRMQDLCRNFAQHVFVMSAVSGGSLGAAVFSGLTQEYAKNEPAQPCLQSLPEAGQVEKAADTILSRICSRR